MLKALLVSHHRGYIQYDYWKLLLNTYNRTSCNVRYSLLPTASYNPTNAFTISFCAKRSVVLSVSLV